jgi:hypothetical protein
VTSYSALSPVSVGVYTALNVAAVTSLARAASATTSRRAPGIRSCSTRCTRQPQAHMGSQPGRSGQLPQIDLTVHVFSQFAGLSEAQAVMNAVIGALATAPAVTGYSSWAIFHDDTINLGDQLVAGVKVKELVAKFRLYVELQ